MSSWRFLLLLIDASFVLHQLLCSRLVLGFCLRSYSSFLLLPLRLLGGTRLLLVPSSFLLFWGFLFIQLGRRPTRLVPGLVFVPIRLRFPLGFGFVSCGPLATFCPRVLLVAWIPPVGVCRFDRTSG
jgi:hypothetical protein